MSAIVTFYSYKGGVGRTMALANIAVILAKRGLKTLIMDFDLEGPGLHRYFHEYLPSNALTHSGVLELLEEGFTSPLRAYTVEILIPDARRMDMMIAGASDSSYNKRVLDFSWDSFFRKRDGSAIIDRLRTACLDTYDIVLIDSRTGITDIGGVCTIQLPDILVPVLVANQQSLDGTTDVIRQVQEGRQHLPWDTGPATILPILSRFDSRAEQDEGQYWLSLISKSLANCYNDWLPKGMKPRQILERTKLPYVPKFAYGEKLPVLLESGSDPDSLAYAYETIAAVLYHDFTSAGDIAEDRDRYVRSMDRGFVRDFQHDVCLSSAEDGRKLAERIASSLREEDLKVWDYSMIQPGELLEKAISSAMEESRLLCPLFLNIVDKPFAEAIARMHQLARSRPGLRAFVPILVEGLDMGSLPDLVLDTQGVIVRSDARNLKDLALQLLDVRDSLLRKQREERVSSDDLAAWPRRLLGLLLKRSQFELLILSLIAALSAVLLFSATVSLTRIELALLSLLVGQSFYAVLRILIRFLGRRG